MSDVWSRPDDTAAYLAKAGMMPQATPAPKPPAADDYTAKRLDLASKAGAIDQTAVENLRNLQSQYMKMAGRHTPVPADPRLQDVKPPPQFDYTDPMKALLNPGVLVATLGSFFSRAPMTAALNAGAAAVNAYHKGEKELYDKKRQEWKDNVEQALKENEIALERYNVAWKRSDASVKDKMAEMQAIASAMKMEPVLAALQSGQVDRVDKIYEGLQKAQDHIRDSLFKYELSSREHMMTMAPDRQAMNKFMQEHPDATAEEMAKFVQSTKYGSPQSLALQKFLAEHPDATPEQLQAFNQAGSRGRSAISMYMNKYLQEHPGASSDDVKRAAQTFSTQITAQNRFLSGPQGNTIRSLNVVVSHLDTMKGLAEDLKNGNLPAFNRLAQRFAEETGQPAPTNFDTAKQIVGTEIIKALGVAGAGTEAERREAADAFYRARSPEQLEGAIKVAQALLGGQLQGLKRQYSVSTGLPEATFNDMLEPSTREFLSGNTRVSRQPPLSEWLPMARSQNPGVSDKELTDYYSKKYGVR